MNTHHDWRVITLEDWASIRRLAGEGVPKAQIASRLGISRTTVIKAVPAGPGRPSQSLGKVGAMPRDSRRRYPPESKERVARMIADIRVDLSRTGCGHRGWRVSTARED